MKIINIKKIILFLMALSVNLIYGMADNNNFDFKKDVFKKNLENFLLHYEQANDLDKKRLCSAFNKINYVQNKSIAYGFHLNELEKIKKLQKLNGEELDEELPKENYNCGCNLI